MSMNEDRLFELAKDHFSFALGHIENERWIDAERELRASHGYMPNRVSTLTNLSAVLIRQKRFDEAEVFLEKALTLDPQNPELIINLGVTKSKAGQFDLALERCERVIQICPDHAGAWLNRGSILIPLKRYDEAIESFDHAIKLNSSYAEAYYNLALLQLQLHDYKQGFKNYLWRWKVKNFTGMPLLTSLPRCRDESLGGNVLLWAEQGVGDEIFYSGMLALAQYAFKRITLIADTRLHSILKRAFPGIEFADRREASSAGFYSKFDCQAPIADLGYLLAFDKPYIQVSRKPFLFPDAARAASLKRELTSSGAKLVCGLSWRSNNKLFGASKSTRLQDFKPVLKQHGLTFLNLQYGDVDAELEDLRQREDLEIMKVRGLDVFNDIEGLVALIDACDVVVTTSSITAHLTGALGKRGCVLVPFSEGRIWYWHLEDKWSFWYPSLRVFYQDRPNDWSNTIFEVANWLEEVK